MLCVIVREIPFDLAPRTLITQPQVKPEAATTAVHFNQTSTTTAQMTTLTTSLIDNQNTY